ncbi:MAG: glycosyltransferase family 4 protein [Candidatus Obscuribacterales bacterium]|nr:glycosyltransferase family 4 protein [Candidatus Obscuribacterales bacterium]
MNFLTKLFSARVPKDVQACALDPQKVLLVLPWLPVGGVETLFTGLVRHCPNYHFDVVTTRETLPNMGDRTESFEKLGCSVTHLPRLKESDEERKQALISLLKDGRYGNAFLVGSTMAYELLPEIKKALPGLNVIDQQFNDGKHLVSTRSLHQYINATIVPSAILHEQLQDLERVYTIPHGIEIPATAELDADRALGKSLLPESYSSKFVVSFFGRLAAEKDPHLFVHLVAKLKSLPNTAFCMVGDGPDRESVLDLINSLGLTGAIKFFGFTDRIDPLVAASDVVVVPSVSDGQPLVVLHSQLHGKPVIASSVGSIPLMIDDGNNGFLVDAKDIDSFAAKITELYEDRDLLKSIGLNAFNSVREKFDLSLMADRYRALLLPLP